MKIVFGLLVVMLAVSGCATMSLAPPTTNVTGNWVGTWQYANVQLGSGDVRGAFQQDGANLSGNFDVTGPVINPVANISGAVSGNEIILSLPATGRLTVNGDQITGTINGLNAAKLTLRKQ
jgi:hypothetical protein